MHILLTGGTGLIGSALVAQWQQQHKLTVLSRSAEKAQRRLGTNVKVISTLTDVDFNTVDVVVNLAGEPIVGKRWTAAQKLVLCNSRWHCTEQIVLAIKAASKPPKLLISGSAIGVYGAQQSQCISEDYSHYHNDFAHQLCQRWETLALEAESPSTRVCILRTGIVLAKAGGALSKMLPAFKLGLGGRIGSGEQYMSWIHMRDMLRLIDFLLLHPTLQGTFNATAPTPVTNSAFSQSLAEVLHRPTLLPMPAIILKFAMGEMADLLLTGQRVIPANLSKAGFEFTFPTLTPALQELLK
ncbi:TIGR01777 family oxidoreductase [Rheinheimera baltica]|uniref:TIGR01777 family oxidoreductase n=1 Tax=Rheinheimera baltica TaxID=67576 RepID=A0ABT9HU83_9GAMM|nr:TIGR01777 family oxidoreductase [Rheinheimera baltica]MDP5134676.1 TIGR01777 family oxidoreductase [Rheinheimera baltica]MDP5141569.1 TIGR01777 family oxidoreductase [Rheinheimera baltica]MDP5191700.1 TIGR01777 family oxidoreductase [Rheinheimera baltica]